MKRAAFLHSAELDGYHYPEACPFNTARAARTLETVESMGLMDAEGHEVVPPVAATRAELEWFHEAAYLDAMERAEGGEIDAEVAKRGLGTPDCPIFKGMTAYAALASGATLTGARLILEGRVDVTFNPSGGFHHAMPGRAAGFCYVNDIVLAAMALADAGKRVCFLDIDVHHCDGVQHAFYARRDVMTVSMHESGKTLFPGTGFAEEIGEGEGAGYTVNIPLPVGTYDEAYLRAFRTVAFPVMRAYDPDVIIVEIGMDALAGDPLAHLHLTNNAHADVLGKVMALGKPVLATGGGGYHVPNTVRGWALAWGILCGEDHSHDYMVGMGGVMLENTDWVGGLRDRVLISDGGRRDAVDAEIEAAAAVIRERVFPVHGLA